MAAKRIISLEVSDASGGGSRRAVADSSDTMEVDDERHLDATDSVASIPFTTGVSRAGTSSAQFREPDLAGRTGSPAGRILAIVQFSRITGNCNEASVMMIGPARVVAVRVAMVNYVTRFMRWIMPEENG
jgi:hypothetical protein